jgi:hypothetical protein
MRNSYSRKLNKYSECKALSTFLGAFFYVLIENLNKININLIENIYMIFLDLHFIKIYLHISKNFLGEK